MNAAISLFVVALLGAEAAPNRGTPLIQYQVKLIEMDGLKWRESLYARLQPVTRQGNCTIWTADREASQALAEKASRLLLSPQVLSESGGVAAYNQRTTRKVASQVTRHADGPVDQAVSVAYSTDHENLREGCQFTMSGRKLDQGMLVRMVVEDSRVAAVHQIKLTEHVADQNAKDGQVALNPLLEVPEVVRATLEGEWLIPNNGVLVASLGAHTLDDGHGKAVVRERLLLVDAAPLSAQKTVDATYQSSRVLTYVAPARLPHIPAYVAPAPAVPSRSLPLARNSEGVPVPLPPLPEAPVPPTSIPGTSEPCATPQAPPQAKEKSAGETEGVPASPVRPDAKSLDRDSHPVGYLPETKPMGTTPTPTPSSTATGGPSAPKPYLFRVPIGPGFEIEISAKVAPSINP